MIGENDEILKAFTDYYKNLFTLEDGRENIEECRNKVKRLIPRKVSLVNSDMLANEILMEEIKVAILSMENNKAPSLDGLTVEFYKANLKWIAEELYLLYKEACRRSMLGTNINKGLIKLLPKEGDKTLMMNWS